MRTIVFIDLEEQWKSFPEEKTVGKILRILNQNRIKACFNVCGKTAELFPRVVKKIHDEGHEIAAHGYAHENFVQLSDSELVEIITKTNKIIKKITGQNPAGMRNPWLVTNTKVDSILSRYYRWSSNKHTIMPELFESPEGEDNLIRFLASVNYLFYNKKITKNKLTEIPLISSYDRDLFRLVCVEQNTPDSWLDYACKSIINQRKRAANHFNLNFKCWVVGTGNRLGLFENLITKLNNEKNKFILPRDLT